MDNKLGIAYIEEFDVQTDDGTDDTRLLAIDEHKIHVSDELIKYAMGHKIEVMCYIPHSTLVYQGLNVGIHGAVKTHFRQEHNKLEEETGETVTKDNFIEVYSKAVR